MSTAPLATVDIPEPSHNPDVLQLHVAGSLTMTRSIYSHWRKRRNAGLRSILEKLTEPYWPEPPENPKDQKAADEYRRKCQRAYRRGADLRRDVQALLMAAAETDARIAAGLDTTVRSLEIVVSILGGEPVSRAARRENDTDLVRSALRVRDEIDALDLADDPAVVERINTAISDLKRQLSEAQAALAALNRQFEEDRALSEKVALKARAMFARIDAFHEGMSDDAIELHRTKMMEAWRAGR